jgi:hypothetical protein
VLEKSAKKIWRILIEVKHSLLYVDVVYFSRVSIPTTSGVLRNFFGGRGFNKFS